MLVKYFMYLPKTLMVEGMVTDPREVGTALFFKLLSPSAI